MQGKCVPGLWRSPSNHALLKLGESPLEGLFLNCQKTQVSVMGSSW